MFWAHSDPNGLALDAPGSQAQLLSKHLGNVSGLAKELAQAAAPDDAAFQAMAASSGMLHDVGKYAPGFQRMIAGAKIKCPHSIYGALAAAEDPAGGNRARAYPVAAVIAAHHAGLSDRADLTAKLLAKELREMDRTTLAAFWNVAIDDQPGIVHALEGIPATPTEKGVDLLIRMLLSCLVDADRLDTAGRINRQEPLNSETRLAQLKAHLLKLSATGAERGTQIGLLEARTATQEACRKAAQGEARLLSLSVPTGGGKTLAAMRFALERAAAYPGCYRRVIVVIPFLSIIEQNAEVYTELFGADAVLEHHSGATRSLQTARNDRGLQYFKPEGEEETSAIDPALSAHRQETENWDAPMIVTTSVRFFESLFSNHPSDLRRVHNMARSIIILDEVQTLPRRLLAPLLGMLRELTEQWGCTVLMTTATQPAFEGRKEGAPTCLWKPGTVQEIIDDPAALHQALQRVRIEWRLNAPTSWPELAAEMIAQRQVLCVVNVREHAAVLYDLLRAQAESAYSRSSVFHLSTRMCAQHRLDVLGRIRCRLDAGQLCRVVSTQLIEAGVDVDFPVAYRALGPLDAIVQVSGRVDREGKATAKAGIPAGRLIVFQTEDGKTPPNEYAEATGVTAALARGRDIQPADLDAMQRYFERYYGDADEKALGAGLAAMRTDRELKFRTLAEQFEMISSRTRDVFVSYGAGAALISQLVHSHHLDFRLLRDLQRYSVGLQPWEFDAARQAGLIVEVSPESGVWVCSTAAYDEDRGVLTRQDEAKLIV